LSDNEVPTLRGATVESGWEWSLHEGLASKNAETETRQGVSDQIGLPLTGEAVRENE